jgi:hypothetical protein
MAEALSQLSISTQTLNSCPGARLFDAHRAATVGERALRRLRDEGEPKRRLRGFRRFERLPHRGGGEDVPCANRAATLG